MRHVGPNPPQLDTQLELPRCPQCGVDTPQLSAQAIFSTNSFTGQHERHWKVYVCARCGGAILAWSNESKGPLMGYYPSDQTVDDVIPVRARAYLQQAIDCLHAPTGAVLLAGGAIDAMLKEKQYKEGSLYRRIDQAAADHLITQDMAKWAHEVRLEANDQRHADEAVPLPTQAEAQHCIDFALAFAEFLFVLPSRVRRGLKDAGAKVEGAE